LQTLFAFFAIDQENCYKLLYAEYEI